MFRSLLRIAPFAMMGYRWWQRRQGTQGQQPGQQPGQQTRPGVDQRRP